MEVRAKGACFVIDKLELQIATRILHHEHEIKWIKGMDFQMIDADSRVLHTDTQEIDRFLDSFGDKGSLRRAGSTVAWFYKSISVSPY